MLALILTFTLAEQPTAVATQVFETSGEVDRIDQVGRTVTIRSIVKTPMEVSAPIYVGPDLPIFDQLSIGDRVTIRFYDAYIVEVTPGARMVPPKDTTAEAQKAVTRDDVGVMQQLKLVVTIDAVDQATGMVTYHGGDNRRVLRAVQRPELLQNVKVGDVVTITFTRASAVSISKAP